MVDYYYYYYYLAKQRLLTVSGAGIERQVMAWQGQWLIMMPTAIDLGQLAAETTEDMFCDIETRPTYKWTGDCCCIDLTRSLKRLLRYF